MGKPKQVTKKDLIQSAKKQLLHKGQSNVTLRKVAEAAGVTQGVVYYHFKTKDQLLDSLMQDFLETMKMKYRQGSVGVSHPAASMQSFLTEESYKAQTSAEEHQLLFELAALSLHQRSLHKKMGELLSDKVKVMAERAGGSEKMGRLMAAITDGLALQSLFDPGFQEAEAYGYAKKVFEILLREDHEESKERGEYFDSKDRE